MSLSKWHDLRAKEAADNRALANKHASERQVHAAQYNAAKIAMAARHAEEKAALTMRQAAALEAYRAEKQASSATPLLPGRAQRAPEYTLADVYRDRETAQRMLNAERLHPTPNPDVLAALEADLATAEAALARLTARG